MGRITDLYNVAKFRFKRVVVTEGEQPLGCECTNYHFVVILKPDGSALLRCTSCYKELQDVALINVVNDQTNLHGSEPLIRG